MSARYAAGRIVAALAALIVACAPFTGGSQLGSPLRSALFVAVPLLVAAWLLATVFMPANIRRVSLTSVLALYGGAVAAEVYVRAAGITDGVGVPLGERMDRYGFNNPTEEWDRPNICILAIGDSFTQGADVAVGRGYIDVLRDGVGAPVINLGAAGTGPVEQAVRLAAFGPLARPRLVLWFYYEGNDINDLKGELASPELRDAYDRLPATGSTDARAALMGYYAKSAAGTHAGPPARAWPFAAILKLSAVRAGVGFTIPQDGAAFIELGNVFGLARAMTDRWGAAMVAVYIPSETRYSGFVGRAESNHHHSTVLALLAAAAIPVLDLTGRLDREDDPRTLYRGHFTETGYSLVGGWLRDEVGGVCDGHQTVP